MNRVCQNPINPTTFSKPPLDGNELKKNVRNAFFEVTQRLVKLGKVQVDRGFLF